MAREERRAEIALFLLQNCTKHSRDLVTFAAEHFGLSRQGVFKHVKRLLEHGELTSDGSKRGARYSLPPVQVTDFLDTAAVEEDVLWRRFGAPIVEYLPENVRTIAYHGFTEMVNNVRDHSGSPTIFVSINRLPATIQIQIGDAGVGIFEKIRQYAQLPNINEAVFELSKGKFTTDPEHHSGEGIFFTSRIFDHFAIRSGGLYFSHVRDQNDWLLEHRGSGRGGTDVFMDLNPGSDHTTQEVYQRFASDPDALDFSKTVIAVKLLETGAESLISRSQAKRLLARLTRFREVVLDFVDVETIGQAFADEIFRVYSSQHPEVELIPARMSPSVDAMVRRAQRALQDQKIHGPALFDDF